MVDAGGLNPPDEKSSCGFESRPGHANAIGEPGQFVSPARMKVHGSRRN